jgi:hypothetical protein
MGIDGRRRGMKDFNIAMALWSMGCYALGVLIGYWLYSSRKNRKTKYEVRKISPHENYVDERLKTEQDEGWEICGDVLLKNSQGSTFFYIPMRRKVNSKGGNQ